MFEGFEILYGTEEKYVNVTSIALSKCLYKEKIYIPGNDVSRANIFGDPLFGVVKHIMVVSPKGFFICPAQYDTVISENDITYPYHGLDLIHTSLKFSGGSNRDDYPEQLMAVMFIEKDSKVLELGSNIGRNTLTIASILNSPEQLVTLECDPNICNKLRENLSINNKKNVKVEQAALSKRKLFQIGWNTYPEETKPHNAVEINTISFKELEEKHQIQFDTLVADCEGALYFNG
jgi:FkbM family methyltransferase